MTAAAAFLSWHALTPFHHWDEESMKKTAAPLFGSCSIDRLPLRLLEMVARYLHLHLHKGRATGLTGLSLCQSQNIWTLKGKSEWVDRAGFNFPWARQRRFRRKEPLKVRSSAPCPEFSFHAVDRCSLQVKDSSGVTRGLLTFPSFPSINSTASPPGRAIDHVICGLMSAPSASTAAQRFPVAVSLSTSAVQTRPRSDSPANQYPSAVNRIRLRVTGNQRHKYSNADGHTCGAEAFWGSRREIRDGPLVVKLELFLGVTGTWG